MKIGNNNKIQKSVIGNNNKLNTKEENKVVLIIIEIIVGIIIAGVVFLLGWN